MPSGLASMSIGFLWVSTASAATPYLEIVGQMILLGAGLGSTTFRDESRQLGLEPDECYYLGAERDGVPDVAIEVVWQHGGLDKLRIFAGLGVPEVWMWRRGSLSVYRLTGSTYEEHPRSALLPELDVQYLAALAMHPDQAEATRLWARFVERQ